MVQFIVILIILWIIGSIWSFLSDHKETILQFAVVLGLIALVFVLISLPPIVWLVVLFVLACVGVYHLIKRKKMQKFVRWMDYVGITEKKTAPAKEKIQELAENKELIEELDSGQIVSKEFCKRVLYCADLQGLVSKESFQYCCQQSAPAFNPYYLEILLDYLSDSDQLLPLLDTEPIYISNHLKSTYIDLFQKEGAATADEFATVCKTLDTGAAIQPNPQIVAVTILNYLVSKGKVEKIELKELGETLFMGKKINEGSNLVRREINLDD